MAGGATDVPEHPCPFVGGVGLLVGRRLEVVQKVELEIVHESRRNLVPGHVAIGIESRIGNRWSLDGVELAVQHHPGRGDRMSPRRSLRQIRIRRIQSDLPVERPDDEFADRYRLAVREEGPHAQIGIHALDERGVEGTVGTCRNRSEGDALRLELFGHRLAPGGGGRIACARIWRSCDVISSASISFSPRPNRWGRPGCPAG